METNEAGKRKKEWQEGGVVIFNQHHQESLYEKGKIKPRPERSEGRSRDDITSSAEALLWELL